MKCYIYSIEGPDGDIRYIGETTQSIEDRAYKHIHAAKNPKRRTAPVHKWIYSLLQKGERPIFKYVDECDLEIWGEVEKMYISQFKCWGFKLLNVRSGGQVKITKDMKINGNIRSAKSHEVEIFQLNDDLQIVNTFKSGKQASEALNFKSTSSISNALKGRAPRAGGFYWCYASDYPDNLNITKTTTAADRSGLKVLQLSDNGEILQEFKSIKSTIGAFLKSPYSNYRPLKNAIKNGTKWRGFYWKMKE